MPEIASQIKEKVIMDSKKSCSTSNKIREIVRLQQILKKWKKVAANANSNNNSSSNTAITPTTITTSSSGGNKGIKFLKRTLSFTDLSSSNDNVVPKGFLAVCVGKEKKKFNIPTHYLRHQAFEMLLREAEEEFGFQQEGVLKLPCDVLMFEKILKVVEDNKKQPSRGFHDQFGLISSTGQHDCDVSTPPTPTHHAQLCR